ncbi:MAG: AAA family ATPase [Halopenitus sp.]
MSRDESTPPDDASSEADGPSRDIDAPIDTDRDPSAVGDAGPQLVVVCGLPGVGKTTVANRVARLVDGDVLRTDAVRKDLFPEPKYTEAESRAVYRELLARAATRLADEESVVLDATFKRRRTRRNAQGLARAAGVPFRTIKVECDESVVERRIANRDGLSDADFEIHRKFRREFDRIEVQHGVVDNSRSEAATLEQVDEILKPGRHGKPR